VTDLSELRHIRAPIPDVFAPLFDPQWRNLVFWGGRGKAVSWSYARALLIKCAYEPLRVLCTRELQTSIKDSVHQLLEDQIALLGLNDFYDTVQSEIRSINGGGFIFKGIRHNVQEIKSTEGIDICWVAEAEKCSEQSWRILIPTIRKPSSQIWVDFNTSQPTDPTYVRFIERTPPKTYQRKLTYRDNPFFPEILRQEMEYDRKVDPESAAHVWDGEFEKHNAAAIFKGKWRIDSFIPAADWDGPYQGADWGFSVDPTVLVRTWIHQRTLYIEYEAYKVGCELDDLDKLFDHVPASRNFPIKADSARPETISHVKKKGFNIDGAIKYKGSVEEGIAFLRSFEGIVIHERCKHTINEAKLYSYKLDRLTDEPTTDIEDRHNHCWDAVRYALEKIIMKSKGAGRPSARSL
jgi:phage terminase large subunit